MKQTQEILMNFDVVTDIQDTVLQVKDLNKELLVLRLAFGQLKAAIAEAAAPLLSVLVPALTTAIRWATRLVKTIGQVIAGVLGITVAQKKLQKVVVSTGKAIKRTVAGFDQLNRLQGNTGGTTSVHTVDVQVPNTLPPQVQQIVDAIKALLVPLQSVDLSPLRWEFERLKEAMGALWDTCGTVLTELWHGVLVPFLAWGIEELAPVLTHTLTEGIKLLHVTVLALRDGFKDLWIGLEPVVKFLGDVVITVVTELGNLFARLRNAINDDTIAIRETFFLMGVDLEELWKKSGNFLEKMRQGFSNTFQNIGDLIIGLSNGMLAEMGKSIQDIGKVFSDGWKNIWGGVGNIFKAGINAVIGVLNSMIGGLAGAINAVVGLLNKLKVKVPDWVPEFGGQTFGFSLKTVTAPQIPFLAKGAVLPANQPFLAVVGDQKHGTNIEAPLATIQEAVALTMEDLERSNLAGHQATTAVLQQILAAVLGIRIGDTEIGQAAQRYQDRLMTLRGNAW